MSEGNVAGEEVWLAVPGYLGIYEASNLGRIRNILTGKVLKPSLNRGYAHVALYGSPGVPKTHYIHATVLRAFCGPAPFDGAEACHNDGDKSNNRLTNLRWGSHQDNIDDRLRHGRQRFGTGVHRAKLTEKQVREMRRAYAAGQVTTYSLAKQYGLSTHTTWCAVTGKTWKHIEGAINNVK